MILQQDPTIITRLFGGREHAARLLAGKLEFCRNSNCVIIAVSHGGVPVACQVALDLSLPLEIVACRKIKHPGDSNRTIGSVCRDEVVIHDDDRDIPREYIQHAVVKLQNIVRRRQQYYDEHSAPASLKGKTVVVVDDWLRTGDTILACVKNIQKQEPAQIIVASPIVTHQAIQLLRPEVNDIIFLFMDDVSRAPLYKYFPSVNEEEVVRLIESFKEKTKEIEQLSRI